MLVELTTVVKDQFDIRDELRHVATIGVSLHLMHDRADVHRVLYLLPVLLVELVADGLGGDWLEEVGGVKVIVKVSKDDPARLNKRVVEFYLSKWIVL